MKLALLIGNRYNPWHLRPYTRLRQDTELTAFRAESEIQQYFDEREDPALHMNVEPIHFDTQTGNPVQRLMNTMAERYGSRVPAILPFVDRLAGYDVIQSWELFTDWTEQALEAKARYGTPVALMVWDNILYNNEDTERKRAIKARALREADRFIVHTERSKVMLELEGADPERIRMTPPGVDTDHFSPGTADRAALGLREDAFVILFVGWLLQRKGIDFLLPAVRLLRDRGDAGARPVQLAIVASGPGRERVEALIERLGIQENVVFLGSRLYPDMADVFRACDVFTLPSIATESWQEQFGMAMIEAMATGKPVVATWSGAIGEINLAAAKESKSRGAALMAQPNDYLELAHYLGAVARDRAKACETLGVAGREAALKFYSLDVAAAALSDVYDELV